MKKSSKPIKNSLKKRRIKKNIKLYSYKLDDDTFQDVQVMFDRFGNCENWFYQRFGGINHMLDIRHWQALRNDIRLEQKKYHYALTEMFGIQGKHWVMALFNTCSMLKSIWSNTTRKIKKQAQNNSFTHDERHYLNFVLSIPVYWYAVLKYDELAMTELVKSKAITKELQKMTNKMDLKQIKHLNSYIRRLTRRYLPKAHVNHCRTILLDENMYYIQANTNEFRFISLQARRQFKVKLTSSWHYKTSGNLQLVLDYDKKRLEIHKTIDTKVNPNSNHQNILGIDKGLATLISCSSGNEYGKGFGSASYQEVEYLAKRSQNRNLYIQLLKELNQNIKKLELKLERSYTKRTASNLAYLRHKAQELKQNHIGAKRYNLHHRSYNSFLKSQINHDINALIKNEQPTIMVKEDLSFTKDKLPATGSLFEKRMRRTLSSWIKGILNERLEYKLDNSDIKAVDVNPAYTSQYCPACKQKYLERTGPHKSIDVCARCGRVNANTTATMNIRDRYFDNEITLYTPYKQVKEILDKRADEYLAAL